MTVGLRPLLTHEMGSLAKPGWRVKSAAGKPLSAADIEQAETWGKRLDVPGFEELIGLLRGSRLEPAQRRAVAAWSSHYALRLLESAGLDVVYDGEQQRSEMYQWAVAHTNGFEFRGLVRSWDNKYYSKAAVVGPVSLKAPYHNQELDFIRGIAEAKLKIPVTGAYTLADWSYDERYFTETSLLGSAKAHRARRREARRRFTLDLARKVIRPNVEALLALGAEWIQIDEPGASTDPQELDLFVESFNSTVDGLDGFFSTHLCFSDYRLFFPAIEAMTGCKQFAVGFANEDTRNLGITDEARPGYQLIRKFRDLPHRPALGLGVLDVHTDFVEPPELIRDRILYAVKVFGGPERIHVTPDCGLRTRSLEVSYAKLRNMVEGVELAKSELHL